MSNPTSGQQWEYRAIEGDDVRLVELLNEAGREGWEAVSHVRLDLQDDRRFSVLMKRAL